MENNNIAPVNPVADAPEKPGVDKHIVVSDDVNVRIANLVMRDAVMREFIVQHLKDAHNVRLDDCTGMELKIRILR